MNLSNFTVYPNKYNLLNLNNKQEGIDSYDEELIDAYLK
jgi:hypothetical protein